MPGPSRAKRLAYSALLRGRRACWRAIGRRRVKLFGLELALTPSSELPESMWMRYPTQSERQRLVAYTRQSPEFAVGLSPRGALALLDSAKTWAVMNSRGHLVPEDLQIVLPAVASHRLIPSHDYAGDSNALVAQLQSNVDVINP